MASISEPGCAVALAAARPTPATATAAMTVAIAGSDHAQYAWLMPFATALRARAPGLRLAFRPSHPETLARQLEQGDVDLAIYPPPYASPALLTRKFRDERATC